MSNIELLHDFWNVASVWGAIIASAKALKHRDHHINNIRSLHNYVLDEAHTHVLHKIYTINIFITNNIGPFNVFMNAFVPYLGIVEMVKRL